MPEVKVLVIDQEESNGNLVKGVLAPRGFHVSVALSAKVGLGMHSESQCPFIILDVGIKDLDVRYVVRELKRRDEKVAIILTGYDGGVNLIQQSLNLEVSDYLYKPLKREEIYFRAKRVSELQYSIVNNKRALKGVEEKNISLQKQNILLAKRIEESTKNLTKLYEDLRETYMRTIKALAHALDARDHYTFSHSDNVTRYAELIARQLGLEMHEIDDIMDACQLHDLGKIGVHDEILSKPGTLSEDEYEQIKQHAQKGAQILEPLNFLQNVIDIVKHHHERWDGKGYPDGLKGEDVPLGARIMAVADSYDAMVSARPYRKVGLSKEEAVEEVKRGSGSQYDPHVVEAFLVVVEQF